MAETDPTAIFFNYQYAAGTGITNLRYHLEKHHKDEYLRACQVNGWPNLLPSRVEDVAQVDAAPLQGRPVFTDELFAQTLLAFVVSDDQVSLIISPLTPSYCPSGNQHR